MNTIKNEKPKSSPFHDTMYPGAFFVGVTSFGQAHTMLQGIGRIIRQLTHSQISPNWLDTGNVYDFKWCAEKFAAFSFI